ncbi:MAG TPA: hypothetical protein VGR76_01685, partial [Candidatus Angelobacter sp.]|nr:hypothetical protein [Candidatus Angelobacter sp.]
MHQANQQLPSTSQMVGSDVLNPQSNPDATANLQKIGTPSFQQASSPSGVPSAASPGLSKLGKLAVLLTSGAEGALAGRSAQEQTIAQTGGRRAGGVGTGFQAGFQLPWQRAQQAEQLKQQQAQTGLIQSEGSTIQTPQGPMPAWLAKTVYPAGIRGQATEQAATTRAGATEQAAATRAGATTQAAQTGAGARVAAAQIGQGMAVDVPPDLQQQFGVPPKLPITQLNKLESAANKPLTVVGGANDSYLVNKQTQKKSALGVGNRGIGVALARPTQVADPNAPGQTKYVSGGQAMSTGAAGPQSASVQVPRQAMKAAVPTKIGDQHVAFDTMINHAALLREA